MSQLKKPFHLYLLLLIMCWVKLPAQSQNPMDSLSFMAGEWIGTSRQYEYGKLVKEVPAYQHIRFELDSAILVIQLKSEWLKLHTIIRYDETDSTFYYYPFSKRGTGRYPAEFNNGQLMVKSSETRRFTFSLNTDGGLMEIGEQWIDGEWVKYFEDHFHL